MNVDLYDQMLRARDQYNLARLEVKVLRLQLDNARAHTREARYSWEQTIDPASGFSLYEKRVQHSLYRGARAEQQIVRMKLDNARRRLAFARASYQDREYAFRHDNYLRNS